VSDKKNPLEGKDTRLSKLHNFAMLVDKKYGRGSIGTADENLVLDMPRISHGSMAFEYALGGGIPRGRIVMFYGKKSGGKTTNAKRIVGQAQKLCRNCFRPAHNMQVKSVIVERDGTKREMFYAEAECDCYKAGLFKPEPYTVMDAKGHPQSESKSDYSARLKKYEKNSYEELICAWLDTEGTYDKEWAELMGVDNRRVSYYRPETAEEAIDVFDPWVRTGAVDLLVLDTLAFLTPRDEIEKSSEEWQQGLQARLINKFCVDGDARVVTQSGRVKPLRAVVPGDMLRCLTSDRRVVWRRVSDIWSNGIKPVVQINDKLRVTPVHEVSLKYGLSRENSEQCWGPASSLDIGDSIGRVRRSPHSGTKEFGPGRARLLGYLYGDRSWCRYGGPSLAAFDDDIKDEVSSIVEREFGCLFNTKHWVLVKGSELKGGSARNPIRAWLAEIGVDFDTKARTKVFPESVYELSVHQLADLIGGLWGADGWPATGHIGLTSTSYKMIWQVWDILLRLGIWSEVHYMEATDSYRLVVSGSNVDRFRSVVTVTGEKGDRISAVQAGKGCCAQDWMTDDVLNEIKKLISGREVAEILGLRSSRPTYPEWNKPGRIKLDRRDVQKLADEKAPSLRTFTGDDIWWERFHETSQCGSVEVFDVEMEWDDQDGEPNFEVNGYFVHNCRKVASAMSSCARLYNRAPTQIWCNQVRMKIGQYGGEVMPGGMGQGFSTSIEVKFFPKNPEIELVKAGNKGEEIAVPLWVDIAYKITKNKVASAGVEGFYRMMLSDTDNRRKGDIVEDDQVFRWAQYYGLISKTADDKKWVYRGTEYRTKGEIDELAKSTPEEMAWLKKTLLDLLLQRD